MAQECFAWCLEKKVRGQCGGRLKETNFEPGEGKDSGLIAFKSSFGHPPDTPLLRCD